MSGKLELVKGDMFEGPSDLVVVPCSRRPTITPFVADRLKAFGLPIPEKHMNAGEVIFCHLNTAGNIAQVVAYAASVGGRRQDDARPIEAIGRTLGSFASENSWVQQISSPLIGTGAGGLEPEVAVESLFKGFSGTAPDDALLRVYALDDAIFAKLRAHFIEFPRSTLGVGERSASRPIRVFVSYTRTDDTHAAWVKDLATFLRANGIEARLDIWHLRPGMDIAQWMCNELDLADRVLLVCNEHYAQKADRRHGGVGWEVRIVQGDLISSQQDNPDKYIPIVITADLGEGTPLFLRSALCLHWPTSDGQEAERRSELLRIIYRKQEEAPPLGRPPSFFLIPQN